MINEVIDKLKERYLHLKREGLDENAIFKSVYDLLGEELNKMSFDEKTRFFLAFDRDRKLKQLFENEK